MDGWMDGWVGGEAARGWAGVLEERMMFTRRGHETR